MSQLDHCLCNSYFFCSSGHQENICLVDQNLMFFLGKFCSQSGSQSMAFKTCVNGVFIPHIKASQLGTVVRIILPFFFTTEWYLLCHIFEFGF